MQISAVVSVRLGIEGSLVQDSLEVLNLHAHQPIPWNQPLPYIEGLLFMGFRNVRLTSQKPCQHNNKFDSSETNGFNIPQ